MMKPNFFIIGAPKCGTTAMASYLKDHPAIFMCEPKEPNYFNFDFPSRRFSDLPSYLALFEGANPAVYRAAGEASPLYLNSMRAVKEILKFNPEAKFIVMLRNPVDFVQSFHSQLVFNGEEDILDFEEAWKAQADRREGKRIPAAVVKPAGLIYSDQGMFGEKMERLFSTVDSGRVMTILFDDFAADTKKVYEGVLAFLGVPSDGRNVFSRINENKKVGFPVLQRMVRRVASFWKKTKQRFNIQIKTGILYRVQSLNSRPVARRPLSKELKSELNDCFREDVAKLSRLLGRDLSHWVSDRSEGDVPGTRR